GLGPASLRDLPGRGGPGRHLRACGPGVHRAVAGGSPALHLGDGTEMPEGALGLSGLAFVGLTVLLQAGPLPEEARYLQKQVPDLLVRDAQGGESPLSKAWAERPILLALVFTRCAGVCSPFLSSLSSAEASVGGSG